MRLACSATADAPPLQLDEGVDRSAKLPFAAGSAPHDSGLLPQCGVALNPWDVVGALTDTEEIFCKVLSQWSTFLQR